LTLSCFQRPRLRLYSAAHFDPQNETPIGARNATAGQGRGWFAHKAKKQYEKDAKERQKRKPAGSVQVTLPEQKGQSRDQAGKAVGVSGTMAGDTPYSAAKAAAVEAGSF